jgi:hypothetical protein
MTDPALDPRCSSWTFNADGTLTVRLPPGADERSVIALMARMGYLWPIGEDMPDGSVNLYASRETASILDGLTGGRRTDTDPEAPGGPWYDGPDRCVVDVLNRY